jgi:aminoglycoside phosphotransferase (APT) family kinase protein
VPTRSPLTLAALASAAVPGLQPVGAVPATEHLGGDGSEIDVAVVHDDEARRWWVRSPRTPAAAARLEHERRVVRRIAGLVPFAVPEVAGTVGLDEGGVAAVQRALPGDPVDLDALLPGPGLAAALGRAVAAVHELPERIAEEAGLEVYTAQEHRQRRLAEVDRAAASGHVPAALLARWERALEEAGAWRFVPCVVHGDLSGENVLVEHEDVVGVLDWGEARVADPADDLAWVAVGADEDALESVVEAYAHTRRSAPDRALSRRARLAGELALARWLLHGVTTEDEEVVADAVAMLDQLDAAVADRPW